jgi:hypothetical protein
MLLIEVAGKSGNARATNNYVTVDAFVTRIPPPPPIPGAPGVFNARLIAIPGSASASTAAQAQSGDVERVSFPPTPGTPQPPPSVGHDQR